MESFPSTDILVIDDDDGVRGLLYSLLSAAHYRVRLAEDGRTGIAMALEQSPDLLVLDLSLPDMTGFEICQQLRDWYDAPILILSVKGREIDKVSALEIGADDYLTKPFSTAELLARVRALLRRLHPNSAASPSPKITVGDLTIDLLHRSVTIDGTDIKLTPIEFDLLAFFARNRHRVVSHQTILEDVWKDSVTEDTRTLRVHISNLRRKIEPNPHNPRYLLTEHGLGFRFVAE